MVSRATVITGALVFGLACQGPLFVTAAAQIVSDSSGVRIISYPEGPSPQASFSLSPTPDLVFERVGATGPQPPTSRAWVVRAGDSVVIVGWAARGSIRAFGVDGSPLWELDRDALAREGLETIQWLGRLRGDTIGLWDNTTSQLALLTSTGEVQSIEGVPAVDLDLGPADAPPLVRRGPIVMGALSDGSLVVQVLRADLAPPTGIRRAANPLARFDRQARSWVSLGASVGAEWFQAPGTGRLAAVRLPAGARGVLATAGRLIAVGWSDQPALRMLDGDGVHRASLHPNLTRPRLTAAERASLEERSLATANPGVRARMRAAFEHLPIPERWPAFGSLIGTEDELWVQEGREPAGGEGRRWFVYALDGELRGEVVLPGTFEPTDIDRDQVLGLLGSADGSTAAVRFGLRRP